MVPNTQSGQTKPCGRYARHVPRIRATRLASILHQSRRRVGLIPEKLKASAFQFLILTVTRTGQKSVHSFVRKGSVVSPDAKMTDLDTGKPLPTHNVAGKDVNALGYYPNKVEPDSVAVQGDLPEAVEQALVQDVQAFEQVITRLDRNTNAGRLPWGLEIPLRPFFGVMGVAPPRNWGAISSIQPRAHGGNIDNKELVPGSTLYLPVFNDGAGFSVGDGHAVQGDGEVCTTAIETALTGTFEIHVRRDLQLDYPAAETPAHLITMGMDPDLDTATRDALRRMVPRVMHETGLSWNRAFMLMSLAADVRVTQVVNEHKGIHVMMPKAMLQRAA